MVELKWISYGFGSKLSCLFALIIVISPVGGLIYFLQRVCNLLESLELNLGCFEAQTREEVVSDLSFIFSMIAYGTCIACTSERRSYQLNNCLWYAHHLYKTTSFTRQTIAYATCIVCIRPHRLLAKRSRMVRVSLAPQRSFTCLAIVFCTRIVGTYKRSFTL